VGISSPKSAGSKRRDYGIKKREEYPLVLLPFSNQNSSPHNNTAHNNLFSDTVNQYKI
jgi:hypothetical protein